jgi:hypothetical protein
VGIFIRSAIFLRFDERLLSIANFFFHPVPPLRIGFLNDLFYGRSYSAGPAEMSILVDEKPTFVPGGSAGERSGGARKISCGVARSNSGRAAASPGVGKRISTRQVVWNRSKRCAGARGGARVGEPGLGSGLSLYFTISRDRGFIDRKKYKRGRKPFLAFGHPTLPFGFEIGKINKYAGLNFANLTTKVPMRIVVGAGKMDWLINHS